MKDLSSFLSKAGQNSWGSKKPPVVDKDNVHETKYFFEEGDWRYEDTFFGEKPNGSREVVYYKGQPIWVMTSYGCIYDESSPEDVYGFLKEVAVSDKSDKEVVKGPTHFEDSGYKYFNNLNGSLERFSGEEVVYRQGEEVYTSVYSGGFINHFTYDENENA